MILGIDVGGTHTDGILFKIEDGEVKVLDLIKIPTSRDIISGLLETMHRLLKNKDHKQLKRLVLSTTLATNALAQGKIPPVVLILFPGPGANPEYAFFGEANLVLDGYVDHRGRLVQEPDYSRLEEEIKELHQRGFQHFAVVSKFSCRNPELELKAAEIIRRQIPTARISPGHMLSGSLNFPRRAATAYLNCAVMDIQKKFVQSIRQAMQQLNISTPVSILKADGGTFTLQESLTQPVQSIKSGPAASIMGAYSFSGGGDGIIIDIGGTTTDIGFLINGYPLFLPHGIQWRKLKTLIPGFDTISLPCGGDSHVRYEDGRLKIGPERKGAAAAFGGSHPTPTDALVILQKLRVSPAQYQASHKALKPLAEQGFKGNVILAARAIIREFSHYVEQAVKEAKNRLANRTVFTIHELLAEFKWNIRHIWGMGGPAAALIPCLAEDLNLSPFLLPHHEVTNALGAGLARPTSELTIQIDTARGIVTLVEKGINKEFERGKKLKPAEVKKLALQMGFEYLDPDRTSGQVEITEQESFNVVRGFTTLGQIHHLKVQIKPGSILKEVNR